MNNSAKIILDLCGGTGSWSEPYRAAGYDVRLITLPDFDIFNYEPPRGVYGILAAPPCTDFSNAGAQLWKIKDMLGQTEKSLNIVRRCLNIIECCNPKFWALENPRGRLYKYIGRCHMIYNYKDFDAPYSKTVCLWGKFNLFMPDYIGVQSKTIYDLRQNDFYALPDHYKIVGSGMTKRAAQRSITAPGFASKFFEFNQ